VSGGDVAGVNRTEAWMMTKLLTAAGDVPLDAITPEPEAVDTVTNLINSFKLLPTRRCRVLLVTSGWHMPRSVYLFKKVNDAFGYEHEVVARPSDNEPTRVCDDICDEIVHFQQKWVLSSLDKDGVPGVTVDALYNATQRELVSEKAALAECTEPCSASFSQQFMLELYQRSHGHLIMT
jgi:hypothetical protein